MVHSYSYGWAKGEKQMSRCELVANMRLVHSDWLISLSASGWHARNTRDSHGELVSFVTSLSCLSKISYRTFVHVISPTASKHTQSNGNHLSCLLHCQHGSCGGKPASPSLTIVEQKRRRVARGIWVPTHALLALTPHILKFYHFIHIDKPADLSVS